MPSDGLADDRDCEFAFCLSPTLARGAVASKLPPGHGTDGGYGLTGFGRLSTYAEAQPATLTMKFALSWAPGATVTSWGADVLSLDSPVEKRSAKPDSHHVPGASVSE